MYGMWYVPISVIGRDNRTNSTSSPANKEELFNLRHASARNVVERIFGVLKRRFRILQLAPEYPPEVQARIPAALCAIHNFIREQDPSEGHLPADNVPLGHSGDDAHDEVANGNDETPDARRDAIAEMMWLDYQRILAERHMSDGTGSDDSFEDDEPEDDDWFEDGVD